MINLFKNIVQKRRHLIVDESNVMDALKVISGVKNDSKIRILTKMEVGNCGWADKPNAWFIHYDSTDYQWRKSIAIYAENGFKLVLKEDDRIYLVKEG